MVEALEKEAARKLGDNHPIAEELSTASVNMMNGDFSIEKYLLSNASGYRKARPNFLKIKESLYSNASGCGKLESATLKQAFQVLESIKWSGVSGGCPTMESRPRSASICAAVAPVFWANSSIGTPSRDAT